jgi:hypothetical protein
MNDASGGADTGGADAGGTDARGTVDSSGLDGAGLGDALGGADGSIGDSSQDYDTGAIVDAGGSEVNAPDGACLCEPYWCGCGACDPAQIACAVDPPPCTRGCLSSCPPLAQVTCSCDRGRCIRSGVDASTVGCLTIDDCPPGQCCALAQGHGTCATPPNTCCNVPCP